MAGRFTGTFLLKFISSQKLLSLYSMISVILCVVAISGKGGYVIYSLGALGFFMSIMFPTIFTLGIAELGKDTKIGSSLLVMSVVGGAVFPYIMGTVIDLNADNIQTGYIVPLVCFIVILFFGLIGYKVKIHPPPVELD
jgi:FHS family L-fucose permease-like MFS transporter